MLSANANGFPTQQSTGDGAHIGLPLWANNAGPDNLSQWIPESMLLNLPARDRQALALYSLWPN